MSIRLTKKNRDKISKIIKSVKKLAKHYKELTGRPLGITGEVAEFEAARILKLELADVRQAGYDVIRRRNNKNDHLQVKGRCISSKAPGQRLGSIKLNQKWDGVLLVLMNENLEPYEIYEGRRAAIKRALIHPGSKARNIRGALSISKFKSIGKRIWHDGLTN